MTKPERVIVIGTIFAFLLLGKSPIATGQGNGPYAGQVNQQLRNLVSKSVAVRAGAVEALGVLRARAAEDALLARLSDPSSRVRREAALALAWCGGRKAVRPLLVALDDEDWVTRQAAHVALTNLTGMQFPFESTADHAVRAGQARRPGGHLRGHELEPVIP